MNINSLTERFVEASLKDQKQLLKEVSNLNAKDPSSADRFRQIKLEMQKDTMLMKANIDMHRSLERKIVNETR